MTTAFPSNGEANEIKLETLADGSFCVRTNNYDARLDAIGALTSLMVNGVEFLAPPRKVIYLGPPTIIPAIYASDVEGSKENAFSEKITGNLIAKLLIEVSDLNDHWSAMLFDRQLGNARPIGLYANEAWAEVPMTGNGDFFVGHPVTCDDSKIILQFTQTSEKLWKLEVHNPTDENAKVTLKTNLFFDPLQGRKLPSEPVEIKAGTSQYFDL
jgi:hypothetical protein